MAGPASTRHLESTRSAILTASADLFLVRGGASFSVQEVADRAAVTHRTVYRHFPTRADLLAATARELASGVEPAETVGASVDAWIASAIPRFRHIERRLDIFRRILAAILTADDLAAAARPLPHADDARWRSFREEFAHLDDDEARRAYIGLRHMLSSVSYLMLRVRFEMSPDEAGATLCSGAARIVDALPRTSPP